MSWAPVTFASLWVDAAGAHPAEPLLIFEAPDGSIEEWSPGGCDTVVAGVPTVLTGHGVGQSGPRRGARRVRRATTAHEPAESTKESVR